jgi:hypothetical protein
MMTYEVITGFLKEIFVAFMGTVVVHIIVVWKTRKSRKHRIRLANAEILRVIRSLIVEGAHLPKADRIRSVLSSIARKHNVEPFQLYSLPSLADDAINEILSDSFLSSIQKEEFCALADRLKSDAAKLGIEEDNKSRPETWPRNISVILGVAVLATILWNFVSPYISSEGVILDRRSILWMLTIFIAIPAFLFWLVDLYQEFYERKEGRAGSRETTSLWGTMNKAWKRQRKR